MSGLHNLAWFSKDRTVGILGETDISKIEEAIGKDFKLKKVDVVPTESSKLKTKDGSVVFWYDLDFLEDHFDAFPFDAFFDNAEKYIPESCWGPAFFVNRDLGLTIGIGAKVREVSP